MSPVTSPRESAAAPMLALLLLAPLLALLLDLTGHAA
jgi:hypothetical protein